MKKIYSILLVPIALILFSGCSKDIFKNYDDRIDGTWRLDDVDRIGIGSTSLTFTEGRFIFTPAGKLEYTDRFGGLYQGSWDIRKHNVQGNCNTDNDGNRQCDDRSVRSLQITAIDFQSRDVKSEYFDEIVFTGTNTFKAYIYLSSRTYVFRFRRE
ncbi:MAG: hypothetical protein H7122_18430 [Chitinophagaceae bacterium]|nr:hypothetical protein [Chitinophagaceae bacterium]